MNIYDFTVLDRKGNTFDFANLRGKVILIVNTATECGFTPTYSELEKLYEKYHDRGLEIVDFPCNQFGAQAPGSNDEIHTFCETRFGIKFPQMKKIDVNGEQEDKLYTYLKSKQCFKGFDEKHPLTPVLNDILSKQDPDYKNKSDIKWNFTKFLVSKTGEVVDRFEPTTSHDIIEKKIEELL